MGDQNMAERMRQFTADGEEALRQDFLRRLEKDCSMAAAKGLHELIGTCMTERECQWAEAEGFGVNPTSEASEGHYDIYWGKKDD